MGVREVLKSHFEQLPKINIEAATPTPEDYEAQIALSNEYVESSDKEGFLKSRKGQRFVTLTCLIGNCDAVAAIKCIRERDGRFDAASLGAYD